MQRQEDGKRHPVGFYSATLNDAERNYDIYDLELLAVVKSLENWRTYLAGSPAQSHCLYRSHEPTVLARPPQD
jgi:hypothetical protein